MTFANAAVWIDHHRAEGVKLSAPGSGHTQADDTFLDQIAAMLADVDRLLGGDARARVARADHLDGIDLR